ncbi:MAG TPA: ribosome maturation factor RimM [Steroidobacteraceae bacterium]
MEWLELGRIRRPHGVKGGLHVESFTEPLEALLDYRSWTLCRGAERVQHLLEEGRLQGRELVVRLRGIADRRAAQALVGMRIEVARSELPPPAAREYYRADLVGLAVSNRDGVDFGVLAHFVESAAGAMMVIRDAAKTERWVPASPEYLWAVDLAAGRIVVDWPADTA